VSDSPLSVKRRAFVANSTQVAVAVIDLVVLTVVVGSIALAPAQGWLWGYVGLVLVLLAGASQYRSRLTLSVASQTVPLIACVGLPLLVLAAFRVDAATPLRLLVAGATAVAALLVSRAVAYSAIRTLRARGVLARRTLIVGAGGVGHELVSVLEAHPEYGLIPIGFVDDVEDSGLSLPLFGGVDLLRMVLLEEQVEHVIVAFGVAREGTMIDIFRACHDAAADVHLLPRFFELGATARGRDVDTVWGYPLVHLSRQALRSPQWSAKRALDVSLAAVGLLLVSPLYVALALAVKLSSRGPVHFRQERVGQRGSVVPVLKFRSLRVHDGSDVEWRADEAQVTPVGTLLRKTGLDELPQLWNVLRGDMSLVGPRPERPFFVEQFKSEVLRYDDRHRVPTGLTGLAQVHGLRGDTPIHERVRFDNHYIESWSFMGDVRIIAQTIFSAIRSAIRPPVAESGTGVGGRRQGAVPFGLTGGRVRAEELDAAGAPPTEELATDAFYRSVVSGDRRHPLLQAKLKTPQRTYNQGHSQST